MTRHKYCSVCGSEISRGRKRKENDFSGKQKPKSIVLRKKTIISILVTLIVVSITVPTVYIQLANRAKYNGEITLVTFSFNTNWPDSDLLYLTMKVVNGNVDIDKIHLHSYDGQRRFQSMIVKRDFWSGQFILREFRLQKGQLEEMNHGFSILIDYKFGKQWLKGFFG
ncbi:MAG: hypothetical protein FK730_08205 [Asgard group archaeon]|nr:hypothetical protein [Asgard group archaeon]